MYGQKVLGLIKNRTFQGGFLVAIPAIFLGILLIKFAVNTPVADQYELVPLFQKIDQHTLGWSDLWQQHNEHRILFPKIVLLLLAKITKWNILVEIYASLFLAVIGFLGIAAFWKKQTKQLMQPVFVLVLMSLFYFSPVQWENWLWGWQLEWFLCTAAIIWSIYFLSKLTAESRVRNILPSILLAIIATFSLGSGALIWVAGIALLVIKRVRASVLFVWIAFFVICLAAYYRNYHRPVGSIPLTTFLHHIPRSISYFFAFVGRPISDRPTLAVLIGVLLFTLFCVLVTYIIKINRLQQYSGIICLGLIGLAAGAITIPARFHFGMAGAMSSRYTAFSLFIVVAIILLSSAVLHHQHFKLSPTVMGGVGFICFIFISLSWSNGVIGMRARSNIYKNIYLCSRETNPSHQCLYDIYFPSTEIAKERLDYLKQKGLGGY